MTNPEEVKLVPPGLTVLVHRHDLEPVGRCFTYVTGDMRERGQPELVLTLKQEAGDDEQGLLRHPLELLKILAEQAPPLAVGQYTELGAGGILGRADFRGIVYLPAQRLAGVTVRDGSLAMLVLTADELELVKRFGVMRVVARLAEEHAYFPYPPWIDRGRASVASAGEPSLLEQVASLWLASTNADKQGDTVMLSLPRERSERAAQQLGMLSLETAVAFLAMPPPDATAALVWRPGQASAQAYARPGGDLSRLGGNFCLFVPEQDADGAQLLEDGFAVTLRNPSWQRVRAAMVSGRDCDVAPSGQALAFSLRWH